MLLIDYRDVLVPTHLMGQEETSWREWDTLLHQILSGLDDICLLQDVTAPGWVRACLERYLPQVARLNLKIIPSWPTRASEITFYSTEKPLDDLIQDLDVKFFQFLPQPTWNQLKTEWQYLYPPQVSNTCSGNA